MRLSKDDILKADDIRTEEVDVPEWGGSVLVRGMTGEERDEFEASRLVRRGDQVAEDLSNTRAKLISLCIVDDDGQPLFTRQDVDALGKKSGAALDRVFDVATRLSGMGPDAEKAAAENFGPALNGASSSSA